MQHSFELFFFWMAVGIFVTVNQAGPCSSSVYLLPSVSDADFTSSSIFDNDYGPDSARLTASTGWAPDILDDSNPWIQVDFGELVNIEGVVSGGSNDAMYDEWVESYKVKYKGTGSKWKTVQYLSTNVFPANTDRTTLIRNDLPSPITTLSLRIYPQDCHKYCTIRFDVIGCKDTPTTTTTTTTMTTISPTTKATTPKTTTTSPTTTTSQQTTTTSQQTTTTSLQTTAPYNTSTLCSCTCTDNSYLTSDDLNVKISNIVQNLTVTKRSTSTFLRTKNCAQDSRPEVVYVGYVGIGLLVFVASLIALPDLLSLYLFMYSLWEKGKGVSSD
ncbi:discoidin, CUB and LCCL domain-containing protein 1 [Magallana gigas]|uniref:discoidin, CUB and LCCL domain-containing protein 1 n=1 Tax=Magallana gigas TaxID=29159 RepID=UPI0033425F40